MLESCCDRLWVETSTERDCTTALFADQGVLGLPAVVRCGPAQVLCVASKGTGNVSASGDLASWLVPGKRELAPGVTVSDVRSATEAELLLPHPSATMAVG